MDYDDYWWDQRVMAAEYAQREAQAMKDSLGRETDHRTPCDEGKHEENPNGCRDQTCDCRCHSGFWQAVRRVPEVLDDLGR